MAMRYTNHIDQRPGSDGGFTLVEILVVMLVIALLAAIAIPAFFNQSDKGRDASAKAAARTAETAAEIVATNNDGKYSGAGGVTIGNLRGQEETLNAANLSVSGVTDDEYKVTVTSITGNTFSIKRNSIGTTDLTCTTPGTGGCPTGGIWG